jgi:hypothetical protein
LHLKIQSWEGEKVPDESPESGLGETGLTLVDDFPPPPEENQQEVVEERVRGVGRPPNIPGSAPRKAKFPTPRFRQFTSDADSSTQRPKHAFKWFLDLPQAFKDRCIWYLYRRFPILVEPPIGDDGKSPAWPKYIDKIPGSDPNQITDESDLLNRYGCGRYELFLNEVDVPKGDEGRNILRVFVQSLGGADYRAHPPNDDLINDVSKVDVSHPNNKGYVSYLASIGKLPEQVEKEKEKADMATATVVEKLTDGYEKMADRVIKVVEQKASTKPEPSAPTAPTVDPSAFITAAADTMKDATKMVMESARGMGMKEVVEIIEKLKPNNSELMALYAAMMQRDQARIDFLEQQILEMRKQPATPGNNPSPSAFAPPAPSSPFAYFRDGVTALREMKTVMDELGGGAAAGVGEEAVAAAKMPWWASMLTGVAPHLVQLADRVIRGMEISRMAPGTVVQPNPMPAQGQPTPAPAQSASAPGLPAPTPASAPTDEAIIQQLFTEIRTPLLNHLTDAELTNAGSLFADWFIGGYGEEVYKKVKGYGPFIAPMLREYAIQAADGSVVKPFDVPQLDKFVEEFLSVDPDKDDKDEELK